MKRYLSLIFLISLFGIANAQVAVADEYLTKKGPLTIQPILHASMVMEWNNQTIYIDPSRIEKINHGSAKADLVFITDIHGDHLNVKTLKSVITPKTILVMPLAAQLKLKNSDLKNTIITMRNGDTKKIEGFRVSAIPMYNLPESSKSRHIKGRGNGYVFNFSGTRVYISGDTADIKEMRLLKNIDIAFVCMNMPYTMTVEQAASAVLDFKPKTVYPYHYRGKGGLSDVDKFKKIINAKNASINVVLANWYPKN